MLFAVPHLGTAMGWSPGGAWARWLCAFYGQVLCTGTPRRLSVRARSLWALFSIAIPGQRRWGEGVLVLIYSVATALVQACGDLSIVSCS